jgi:hypothetical protein
MNNFSSFQSQLFRGGVNPNSFSFVNKTAYGITLDPSGGSDYVSLIDGLSQSVANTYQINRSGTDTFLVVDYSGAALRAADFLPTAQSNATIYVKYKHNGSTTNQSAFSHLFPSTFTNIDISGTTLFETIHTIDPGHSFDVKWLVAGADLISYAIAGVADSVTLPKTGYLVNTYEKQTITLGSDASSGIIQFAVNDVSLATQVYVPYRYDVSVESPNLFKVIKIDGIANKTVLQTPGFHFFDVSGVSDFETISFDFYTGPNGSGSNYTVDTFETTSKYTALLVDQDTPNLYYFDTEIIGGAFLNLSKYDAKYSVKVVTNVVDQSVYAIDLCGNGTYYNQPDISFSSGNVYLFELDNSSNDPFNLVFGTTVDGAIDTTYAVTTMDASNKKVAMLDLAEYIGDSMVYFEQDVSGMGYIGYSTGVTPIVKLDFSQETDKDNLTNQIDGSSFTDVAYTGSGFSFVDSSIYVNDGSEMQITNLPDTTFTIMFSYIWRSTSTGWCGFIFYHDNGTTNTNFALSRINGVGYKVNQIKVNNTIVVTTPSLNSYLFNINQKYSLAFVKTSTELKFYIDGTSYTMSNSNTFTSMILNSQGNILHSASVAIENLMIFDSEVDVPNFVEVNFTSYNVTISGSPEVFYIDNSANPYFNFTAGSSYIFDQSDPTNAGQQIVFGYTPDRHGDPGSTRCLYSTRFVCWVCRTIVLLQRCQCQYGYGLDITRLLYSESSKQSIWTTCIGLLRCL